MQRTTSTGRYEIKNYQDFSNQVIHLNTLAAGTVSHGTDSYVQRPAFTVSWRDYYSTRSGICGDVNSQTAAWAREMDEQEAYENLSAAAEDVWAYSSGNGLVLRWQYVPAPLVDLAQNGDDYDISVTRRDDLPEDVKIDIAYSEKGITASPGAPEITAADPVVDAVESLYLGGKELSTAVQTIKQGTEAQMIAKLSGSYLSDADAAEVEWSIANDPSGTRAQIDAKTGVLKVNGASGTFSVMATPKNNRAVAKVANFRIESNTISVTPEVTSVNLGDSASGIDVRLTVDIAGPEVRPTITGWSVTRKDGAPVASGTQVIDADYTDGRAILHIDAREDEGQLTIVATGSDNQTSVSSYPVSVAVLRPNLGDLNLSVVEGTGKLIFVPGDTGSYPVKLSVSPKWENDAEITNPAITWSLAGSYAGVTLSSASGRETTVNIPASFGLLEGNDQVEVEVQVASQGGVSKSGLATIEIRRVTGFSITPQNPTLTFADRDPANLTFTATATLSDGTTAPAQSATGWTVTPDEGFTLSATAGPQTAVRVQPKLENPGAPGKSYIISASLGSLPKATAVFTVLPPTATITITGGKAEYDFNTLNNAQQASYSAAVIMGSSLLSDRPEWSVALADSSPVPPEGDSRPTISRTGVLTVPMPSRTNTSQTYTYVVTAQLENAVSTATFTVKSGVSATQTTRSVDISPALVQAKSTQQVEAQATLSGAPGGGVASWSVEPGDSLVSIDQIGRITVAPWIDGAETAYTVKATLAEGGETVQAGFTVNEPVSAAGYLVESPLMNFATVLSGGNPIAEEPDPQPSPEPGPPVREESEEQPYTTDSFAQVYGEPLPAAEGTASLPDIPAEDVLYNGNVWVTAEGRAPKSLVVFRNIPQNTNYHYLILDEGTPPYGMEYGQEELSGTLQMVASGGDGITPVGEVYDPGQPVEVVGDCSLAVCAKETGADAINIEHSNTQIYNIVLGESGLSIVLDEQRSQPANARADVTRHTYAGMLSDGMFTQSPDGSYSTSLNALRRKVSGDSWYEVGDALKQRDRKLAEAESVTVTATVDGDYQFNDAGSDSSSVGSRIPLPVISPSPSGVVGPEGITITCGRENTTIYYTITDSTTVAIPDLNAVSVPTGDIFQDLNKTFVYDPQAGIPFYESLAVMTVTAIAAETGDITNTSSTVASASYTVANRPVPSGPVLLLGASREEAQEYSSTRYYSATGLKVFFQHEDLEKDGAVIYYTAGSGNEEPTRLSQQYNPNDTGGIALPDLNTLSALVVRALFTRPNYPDVEVAYTIQFTGSYTVPTVYSVQGIDEDGFPIKGAAISNGASIRSGAQIMLELALADIPEDMLSSAKPYVEVNPDGTITTDTSRTEERVDLKDRSYSVPQIRYGVGSDAAVDQIYRQSAPIVLREVTRTDGSVTYTKTAATAAAVITLPEGEVGDPIVLRVQVLGSDPTKTMDTPIDLTYKVRASLPVPRITVNMVEGTEDQVEVNTPISLDCEATGYQIYYTTENEEITEEAIRASQAWEEAYTQWLIVKLNLVDREPTAAERAEYRAEYIRTNEVRELSVRRYDVPFLVERNAQMAFWVRAVAVSVNDTLGNSPQFKQYFRIKELEKAQPVTASPATDDANQTGLKRGATITLSTETVNPMIYYTIDNTPPDPDEYLRYLKYDQEHIDECPTKRILSGGKIEMIPDEDGTFIVRAVARENSEPSILADSPEARFTYQLAKASAPTISPSTSDEEVAKLAEGSQIKLLTKETGVEVYYTTDGTSPVVPAGGSPSGSTKRYDPAAGITMPLVDTFFIITAVVHDPSGVYADSEPVTFYYQSPAPVQAVYAVPAPTAPVVKGAAVQLRCSTDGANIFYEVAYGAAPPNDPAPYQSQSYSADNPIVVDQEMTVKALAEKDGVRSKIATYHYTVAPQLASPGASIDSGSIVYHGIKLHLSAAQGATVIYTKDGSDPTDVTNTKRLYGRDLVLDGKEGESMTIRAYAVQSQHTPSEVETFTYSICKEEDILRVTPPSGAVVGQGTVISMSSAVSDSVIYYTVNGRDPSVSGRRGSTVTLRGEPGEMITLKASVVLRDNDYDDEDYEDDEDYYDDRRYSEGSAPAVFTFTLMGQTQSPTASIPSGAVTLDGASVVLSVKEGAIYYTTDGSDPTASSILYTEPVEVSGSMVLKAIAIADNMAPSEIVTYVYTRAGDVAAPVASLSSGEIESGMQVELTTATEGATIYYSTNGMTPGDDVREELFEYTAPITITRPVTLKMYAYKEGMHSSQVNAVTYTVYDPPEPEPEPEPEGGLRNTSTDRLTSRRTFDAEVAGPSYEDIQLYDRQYSAVVSANEGAIPRDAQLSVKEVAASSDDRKAVQAAQESFDIVNLYDVTLLESGEEVQPSATIEIGLPIPADYQNGIVLICRMNNDGSAEFIPTRRAGGVAYAKVDHLSRYALAAPEREGAGAVGDIPLGLAGAGAAAVAAVTAGALAIARRKRR
ncbi:chitobiase/beta-hexosaminidase C-terminal domain-containing protein [Ligaoa zhengdingensis]|uniref:chitobiase/beta-hexosaminidase C-terminal domain-containing protein n=1 Tax=Ligaoa zhengdingensis TaxID=2763658 RepID=UPI0031BA9771